MQKEGKQTIICLGGENARRCSKCKKTKPLSRFNKNSYMKDGYGNRCRECWKIYYAGNREQYIAYSRKYNTEHRERCSAYYKQYNAKNRVRIHRQIDEWNKTNHERKLQQQHLYNRSPCGKAANKRYQHKRRALLAACEVNDLTAIQIKVLLQSAPANCPICIKPFNNDGRKKSINHIIPFSKKGNNTLSNIQVICLSCNLKKGDKDYAIFNNGQLLLFV